MAIRCTAHRTNGEPCGNYAMAGGWVCHAHGGRAPAVRAAARRRLVEAELRRQQQQAEAKRQRRTKQQLAEQAVRRAALQPWEEELGPPYVWDWHSADTLRRIALEMRRFANELTALASTTEPGRQSQCTGS